MSDKRAVGQTVYTDQSDGLASVPDRTAGHTWARGYADRTVATDPSAVYRPCGCLAQPIGCVVAESCNVCDTTDWEAVYRLIGKVTDHSDGACDPTVCSGCPTCEPTDE